MNRINGIEDEILLEVLNGPVWFYYLYAKKEIAGNIKVLEKLERFRDDGFLEHREELGKRRIYYTLTSKGLVWILNHKPMSVIGKNLKKFLEEDKDKHWLLIKLYHIIEEGYEDHYLR